MVCFIVFNIQNKIKYIFTLLYRYAGCKPCNDPTAPYTANNSLGNGTKWLSFAFSFYILQPFFAKYVNEILNAKGIWDQFILDQKYLLEKEWRELYQNLFMMLIKYILVH